MPYLCIFVEDIVTLLGAITDKWVYIYKKISKILPFCLSKLIIIYFTLNDTPSFLVTSV